MSNKRYTVIITAKAMKELKAINKPDAKKIYLWLNKNLEGCTDPRISGKALQSSKHKFWRYRVGNYRLIASICDAQLTIEMISAGNRKNVYSKNDL